MKADVAEGFGDRLRAALALRGRGVPDLAASIAPEYRLGEGTIYRTVQGKRTPNAWEIPVFAEALDIPEWFLRDGLRATQEPENGAGELAELRRLIEELDRKLDVAAIGQRLAAIEEDLRRLARAAAGTER